jgi:hypothetical protein
MTQYLYTTNCQHDSAASLLAQLGNDIMQQLDRQHQQHMTPAPIYLVLGPMQVSHCTGWYLCEASTFEESHLKTLRLPS